MAKKLAIRSITATELERRRQKLHSPAKVRSAEIKALRANLNLTQEGLATKLGVATGTVGVWERGDSGVSPFFAAKIQALREKLSKG